MDGIVDNKKTTTLSITNRLILSLCLIWSDGVHSTIKPTFKFYEEFFMQTIDPELEMTLKALVKQEHISHNEIIRRFISHCVSQN